MRLRTLREAKIAGQRVILRVAFDVPLAGGRVKDDARIRAVIPTINLLLKKKAAQIILMSYLGRPEGRPSKKHSLAPVALHLSTLLHRKVAFVKDCLDPAPSHASIALLENLRFYPGEDNNEKTFARKLANHGEIFINDAFAQIHRANASIEGITHFLPSYAGLLVEKEIKALSDTISRPKRPFLAIIGGGKADKIGLLAHILKKADTVAVVGVLGNILLAARGKNAGKIKIDPAILRMARKTRGDGKIVLPSDAITAKEPDQPRTIRILPLDAIPKTHRILDAGPATMTAIHELISRARTIFWAGTPGMYENPHFATGTNLTARWMAKSKATTVIAGGDTGAAVAGLGLKDKMTYVSTGGGAALELVEGKELPGLRPLMKR